MTPIKIHFQKSTAETPNEFAKVETSSCVSDGPGAGVNSSELLPQTAFQSLLGRILPDAGGALTRRADFFAPKEAGLLETPEADPLQSCTQLNVSTGSIYFGDVRLNSSVTQYFRISNPNCCAVNYTISGGGYGFSLSTSGGTIPANGSVSVAVTFTPYVAQNYSGSVSISPSGSGVSFTGRGVP